MPRRVVLLGHPVAHSLSPRFQQAALDAAGLPARYEALDVEPEDLPETLAALALEGACGNVTIPYKERVAALCGRLTPIAAAIGAVNTFWFEPDGTLVGDNTDVGGFDAAARALVQSDVAGARVIILGAGGAAAAVCEAVRTWPRARMTIVARTAHRAARLASRYPDRSGVHEDARIALEDAVASALEAAEGTAPAPVLLVNATPLGLDGVEMPIDPSHIPSGVAVMDLTYRQGRTPWIRACRGAGLRAEDGLPMLIEQGALAFERWFGRPANREVMWQAVR